jgi:hypothetical protein
MQFWTCVINFCNFSYSYFYIYKVLDDFIEEIWNSHDFIIHLGIIKSWDIKFKIEFNKTLQNKNHCLFTPISNVMTVFPPIALCSTKYKSYLLLVGHI